VSTTLPNDDLLEDEDDSPEDLFGLTERDDEISGAAASSPEPEPEAVEPEAVEPEPEPEAVEPEPEPEAVEPEPEPEAVEPEPEPEAVEPEPEFEDEEEDAEELGALRDMAGVREEQTFDTSPHIEAEPDPTLDDDPFADDPEPSEPGVAPLFGANGVDESTASAPMASLWTSSIYGDEVDEVEQAEFSGQSLTVIAAIEKGMHSTLTTEIHANGPGRITAKVHGRNVILHGYAFSSSEEYVRFMQLLVKHSQAHVAWGDIERKCRAVIALRDGSRLTIKLPPLSEFPTFSIRKHGDAIWSPTRFIEEGLMPAEAMAFLRSCVAARVNMLFVGGGGSGKTSLMRALSADMGDDERIAVIEQVDELRLPKPQVQRMTFVPGSELDLPEALDIELYDSIDRIIVGEVHTYGLGSMLEVMKITHGSMSTYHADTADDMIARMKVALQKETPNMTADTALDDIRQAVELVVCLERVEGKHRCTQIREIDWRGSSGTLALPGRDLFLWNREAGEWTKPARPDDEGRIVRQFAKWGVNLNPAWFDDAAAVAALRARQ
jgi:pilus assembly protein CpaF